MTIDYQFVDSIEELKRSTQEFNSKPEFWKAILGSAPKYFIHTTQRESHVFALSKFCAFKGVSAEDYLTAYRYKTDGGTTQKHISWLTGRKWATRANIDKDVRKSFDKWISHFFPNYNLINASFITIPESRKTTIKRQQFLSPINLVQQLKLQEEIGLIGEEIAMAFEAQRLRNLGIKNPRQHIDHVSRRNIAAGYDIYSSTKNETRYIEVKSSLNKDGGFFITENEVQTLEKFEHEAYVYLVHVTNRKKMEGHVFYEFNDPIRQIRRKGNLRPVVFKAEIQWR